MVKDDFISRTVHSVLRIETIDEDNNEYIGTAFLYTFKAGELGIHLLVTNAHLVANSKQTRIFFTKANGQNNPIAGVVTETLEIKESDWFFHPDENVDLCAIEISSITRKLHNEGNPIFALTNSSNAIPNEKDLANLEAVEDLLIIGFPNGIYDDYNNRPIIRRGITASDLELDYKGFKEFLVDASLYTGSSGSPVYIYNKYFYKEKENMVAGTKILFVGVIYSILELSVEGEIINTLHPSSKIPTIARTNVSQQLSLA